MYGLLLEFWASFRVGLVGDDKRCRSHSSQLHIIAYGTSSAPTIYCGGEPRARSILWRFMYATLVDTPGAQTAAPKAGLRSVLPSRARHLYTSAQLICCSAAPAREPTWQIVPVTQRTDRRAPTNCNDASPQRRPRQRTCTVVTAAAVYGLTGKRLFRGRKQKNRARYVPGADQGSTEAALLV